MKTQSKLYNFRTRFFHQILKRPIYFKKSLEIHPKSPPLTVIFLHGISADSSTWQKTFSHLAQDKTLSSVRFLSLDLLGFGESIKSDWLKYDYEEFDLALNNSLQKYHINTPVVLVGHSMGCLVAAHFAKKHPHNIQSLILVSPPVIKKDEIAKLPDKFYAKTYSSIEKIADSTSAKTLAKLIESTTSFRGKYLDTAAFNSTMQNLILNSQNYSTFSKLKVPTTIINGRLDPLVISKNLEELAKANPEFIKLVSVMSSHDISKQKYDKIISNIKRILPHAQAT